MLLQGQVLPRPLAQLRQPLALVVKASALGAVAQLQVQVQVQPPLPVTVQVPGLVQVLPLLLLRHLPSALPQPQPCLALALLLLLWSCDDVEQQSLAQHLPVLQQQPQLLLEVALKASGALKQQGQPSLRVLVQLQPWTLPLVPRQPLLMRQVQLRP